MMTMAAWAISMANLPAPRCEAMTVKIGPGKSRQPGRCDQPATGHRGGHAVCLKHDRVVWIEYAQPASP
jgi:hypothetical protein